MADSEGNPAPAASSVRPSGLAKLAGAKAKLRFARKPASIPDTADQEVLWNFFQEQEKPDFFQAIRIDNEAGFDELEDLWKPTRIIFGLVSIITLIYNTYAIILFNIGQIRIDGLPDGDPNKISGNYFLLSDFAIRWVLGIEWISPVLLIAYGELLLTAAFYLYGILNLFNMTRPMVTPCTRWHAVANFFFNIFPLIATMSMVRLLNYITPQVVVPQLLWAISRISHASGGGAIGLVFFLVTRIGCFFAGFDAFLFKFQVLAFQFSNLTAPNSDPTNTLILTLLFVNQMLGVVQLSVFTKQRIFVFIFAGEDGQMSEYESATKATWEAMLCKELVAKHGFFKSMFIWLSFTDADFQKLVLDSKDPADEEGAGAAGQALGLGGLTGVLTAS